METHLPHYQDRQHFLPEVFIKLAKEFITISPYPPILISKCKIAMIQLIGLKKLLLKSILDIMNMSILVILKSLVLAALRESYVQINIITKELVREVTIIMCFGLFNINNLCIKKIFFII